MEDREREEKEMAERAAARGDADGEEEKKDGGESPLAHNDSKLPQVQTLDQSNGSVDNGSAKALDGALKSMKSKALLSDHMTHS